MAVVQAAGEQFGAGASSQQAAHAQAPGRSQRSRALEPHPKPAPQAGFMSTFLSAEKERMAQARLQLASSTLAPADQQHPGASGAPSPPRAGLGPPVLAPFSLAPDNMIGQAYNAAVGQALPLESGR